MKIRIEVEINSWDPMDRKVVRDMFPGLGLAATEQIEEEEDKPIPYELATKPPGSPDEKSPEEAPEESTPAAKFVALDESAVAQIRKPKGKKRPRRARTFDTPGDCAKCYFARYNETGWVCVSGHQKKPQALAIDNESCFHLTTNDTALSMAPPSPWLPAVEQAPVEQAPVEQAPAEQAVAEQATAEQAPVEQAPVEQAAPEQAPAEQAAPEQAPAEQAVAEQATAEQAPVEQAPVEQAAAPSADPLDDLFSPPSDNGDPTSDDFLEMFIPKEEDPKQRRERFMSLAKALIQQKKKKIAVLAVVRAFSTDASINNVPDEKLSEGIAYLEKIEKAADANLGTIAAELEGLAKNRMKGGK